MKKTLFLVLICCIYAPAFSQVVRNGQMEKGSCKLSHLPDDWDAFNGTPDLGNSSLDNKKFKFPYLLPVASPQGGNWIRFFHSTSHDERVGCSIDGNLKEGKKYQLSFYATFSNLNSNATATKKVTVKVGFFNSKPKDTYKKPKYFKEFVLKKAEKWTFCSIDLTQKEYEELKKLKYIIFSKVEVDAQNACYIDDVLLLEITKKQGPKQEGDQPNVEGGDDKSQDEKPVQGRKRRK